MSSIKEMTHDYAVRLGDDALVLGHRLSEMCSFGPFLEEDLAISNVALDFIGRARMFYAYAAQLAEDGSTEDSYAFTRDNRDFRNYLLHELENGDFAHLMVRQYLVDAFTLPMMEQLSGSRDEHLAAIATKAMKESRYHLRRSADWVIRLGDGTEESHRRAQIAVDDLWGFTPELFEVDELERALVAEGIAVDVSSLQDDWHRQVAATLGEATLTLPEGDWAVRGGRQGVHTEALGHLLSELQFMQRAYPGLQW